MSNPIKARVFVRLKSGTRALVGLFENKKSTSKEGELMTEKEEKKELKETIRILGRGGYAPLPPDYRYKTFDDGGEAIIDKNNKIVHIF